jgi:hypothetical protein
MASTIVSSLNFAIQQIAIYLNIFNLVTGIPGGILNLIVFLSLQTFRENTCAFYLIIVSLFNIGQLLTGALSRLLISGFGIDWTIISVFYCKFRIYLVEMFSLVTLTCLCLATIDQYFATCSRPRWQQWSNIKLVRYLSVITIIFSSIFAIVYAIYYDIIVSSTTGTVTCASTNAVFQQYNSYFHQPVMQGFLPNFLTALFGVLAYRNTKNLAYRTVPLIRRELDKQLTRMLLFQVVINIFSLLSFNIISLIVPNISTNTDPVVLAKLKLAQVLSYCIYYFYPAVSIYHSYDNFMFQFPLFS